MSFFYSTPAGMIDFYIFVGVTIFSVIFGSQNIKKLAALAIAVFLFDRANLLLAGIFLPVAAILGCVTAVYATIRLKAGLGGNGFAVLYFVKLLAWTALVMGVLSLEKLAAIATVLVAFQLFILFGGAIDGLFGGRLYGISRAASHRVGSGWVYIMAALAGRGAISRRSEMSQQSMAANQDFQKEVGGA